MSYPSTGFPDYSRYEPMGGRYLGKISAPISTNPASPVLSSTGFGYLTLFTTSVGVNALYVVIVNWGYNSDGGMRFATSSYAPSNDGSNVCQFPIIGEWFTVEHSWIGVNPNDNPVTLIYASNSLWQGAYFGGFGQQSIAETQSCPAGAQTVYGMLGIAAGNAMFSVSTVQAGTWYAQLQQFDPVTNLWITTFQLNNGGGSDQQYASVVLLPAPARVVLFNIGSAAINIAVSLIPGP